MSEQPIVISPLPAFWALLTGSALFATALLVYGLLHEPVWVQGVVFGGAAALIYGLAVIQYAGHTITVDAETVTERRRGRVLTHRSLDELAFLEETTGSPRLVFADGTKLWLSPLPSCFRGAREAEEWLRELVAWKQTADRADRLAPGRSKLAARRGEAAPRPTEKRRTARAPKAGVKRRPRSAGRGGSTVQLPLPYLTFAATCHACAAREADYHVDLIADVAGKLEALADVERKLTLQIPLCAGCEQRQRRLQRALGAGSLVTLVGVVGAVLGWAWFDWSYPGWAWATLAVIFVVNVALGTRAVDRRLHHRLLGVSVERYLGDATSRVVLRFRHIPLAGEAQRLTLEAQEQHLAGV